MKILFLTNAPISLDNGVGNTICNLFGDVMDLEYANIYCRYDKPNTLLKNIQYFQITEKMLLQNLKASQKTVGRIVDRPQIETCVDHREKNFFDAVRKMKQWQVIIFARDFIWKIGRWDSPELRRFLVDFQPNLIFQPIYYSSYLNDIAQFCKQYTNVPMIGYISDDCYSLRQFRFSPLYWIDRLWKRRKVKETIEQCELLYVISEIQKEEYEKIFTPPCKILTKCADFNSEPPTWPLPQESFKLLYAGNLGAGRWRSLALIAETIERLRREGYSVELDTYTATPQTAKMQRALNRDGCRLYGAVPYAQVQRLQKKADVLIHVEGLSLKSRMEVHQSFSTKLVDYFALGKCIFAVGTPDIASIRHLLDHNAAVVASEKNAVYAELKKLLDDPKQLQDHGKKAYACGRKCHNKTTMQAMLMEDLKKAIESKA